MTDKEVFKLRAKLEGNIAAKTVKADENGFEVRAVLRGDIALRRGVNVALLETDKQQETMTIIASKLDQASW